MTSIVFTYNTIIPGVYDINVSAVNILRESIQRNIEGTICQWLIAANINQKTLSLAGNKQTCYITELFTKQRVYQSVCSSLLY